MTVKDLLASIVRTVVPAIAGLLISVAARANIDLSALAPQLVDLICIGLYHAVVRAAETRWPYVGVLLGWKATPTYVPVDVVATVTPQGDFLAGPAAAAPTGARVGDQLPLDRLVNPVTNA